MSTRLLGPHAVDGPFFRDVNAFARDTGWLHGAVLGYAQYGVLLFGALLVVGWWYARGRGARTVAAALWAGAATLVAVAVNQPLVHGFNEARPYTASPHLLVLAHRSADAAFPSDHAVMAGAVAAGLWLVSWRLGVLAAAAALLMAASRVYIAAHYPHDVVAGLLLGIAITLLGWLLVRRPLTALVERLAGWPAAGGRGGRLTSCPAVRPAAATAARTSGRWLRRPGRT